MSYLAYDALTSNTTFTLGNKIPNINFGQKIKIKSKKKAKVAKT